jgi:anti-sigma B factor antagonist
VGTSVSNQSNPFTYEVLVDGDTTTIKCHGRIVSDTAGDLKQLVKPMIPKVRRIVLDLSDVSYIDSAGLGTLVGLKVSAASAAYTSLELVNLSPLVKELLHTTKLTEIFKAA